MKNRRWINLITIFLCGCSIYSAQTDTSKLPVPTQPTSATNNATESARPSQIATPFITATPTYIQDNCLNTVEADSILGKGTGTILLESKKLAPDGRLENVVLSFNAETRDSINIVGENERLLYFSVSPDRKMMAYRKATLTENSTIDELIVSTADGKTVKSIPWQNDWVAGPVWVNNEDILIESITTSNVNNESKDLVAGFAKVNILTDKIILFSITLPNKYRSGPMPVWDRFMDGFVYNPDLTHIVYLDDTGQYVLWNLQTSEIITKMRAPGFPTPRWSPGGDRFLLLNLIDVNPQELYSIDLEGNLTQLTNISAYENQFGIGDYYWSNSGRYITLWLYDLESHETKPKLAILDTSTMSVTNYCFEATEPAPPIWSPDDSQMLIVDQYSVDHSRVFLIDLSDSIAVPLAEDMEPVGWLDKP